ncbi:PulJ/GspJ family protein [Caldimonas brevitalea]|uniref:Prepilin-type N-terminal cleavage/methylation domain-containing protein n=1 Tax=Caldimonas brevitalea TaxID=413882 RepID=A0A0G3BJY4_9BURK|nr:type II secretion system protein [Caldimonas brevitalea]AKJ29727.1 hypothetical protein AAW51_3036 [Caldimonas brevitalea]
MRVAGLGRRAAGFTLIEMLAAVAVGSLLVYLLSQTLTLTQQGLSRATRLGDQRMQEETADRVLRGLLGQLLPASPGRATTALHGSASFVEFSTLPPQSRWSDGVLQARLAVEPDGPSRHALVLTLTSPAAAPMPPARVERRVLLSGLATARLTYYYTDSGRDRLAATPIDPHRLPELVVADWTYSDGGARQGGEIAVRPRVQAPGDCDLDMTTATCRPS